MEATAPCMGFEFQISVSRDMAQSTLPSARTSEASGTGPQFWLPLSGGFSAPRSSPSESSSLDPNGSLLPEGASRPGPADLGGRFWG